MFITFYDRYFNPLADNSSLRVESYNLTRRAYDFNEFTAVLEPIDLDIQPALALLKKDTGETVYAALCPLIALNDASGKSEMNARDMKALFNTECIIDFNARFSQVSDALNYIFSAWKSSENCGFENVVLDVSFVDTLIVAGTLPVEKKVYNVWDLLKNLLIFYQLYIDCTVDLRGQVVRFTVRKTGVNTQRLRLEDYGIRGFQKVVADVNTAVAYGPRISESGDVIKDEDGNTLTDYEHPRRWFLLSDNRITQDEKLRDLFPTKTRIFISDDIAQAEYDAIMELAENRYQETITLDVMKVRDRERFEAVYFDTSFEVWYRGKKYKTLPIGEITENGSSKELKIGNKPIDFIQVI